MRRVITAAAAALVLAFPALAQADAQSSASCVGFEASALSPPGSLAEFPGGMPALHEWIAATFPGTPPGAIVGSVAKLHEGSHEACDEATE